MADVDNGNTKKDRMLRLTNSQKRFVFEKSERIFRAIVNLLEFTKFALNFYFYCLINPDIRRICMHVIMCKKISRPPRVKGQPTTPISFYTRVFAVSQLWKVQPEPNLSALSLQGEFIAADHF
ncbi:hypothetical protein ANCCEY_05311 [Ancylostoma ceylanicum]|uniref:Uncharacterized protein n=1 Tax=Ancylostoma ceylanicum TaxID=53326 RepID=A0A0D6M6V8_9BILA|nr:hypothetical protein ANCCEY_05311 [Ancylostoma ceylanicum]